MKRTTIKSVFTTNVHTYVTVLSFLLLAFMGCKSRYPADILQPDEMKPILFDVMVATEVKEMDTTTATKKHLRDSITLEIHRVLAAHKIDDSLYFRSMAFYEAHPDELNILLDSTRAYGNKLQDSLQKKHFKAADSVHKPIIQADSIKKKPGTGVNLPKKPVNPTVKDSAAIPIEKVKK